VRYNVENALASGKNFGILLVVTSLVVALLMTVIKSVIAAVDFLNFDVTSDPTFFEQFWASLSTILNLPAQASWAARIISILNWVIAIAISGAVIGFITTVITAAVGRLKLGGTAVIATGHTLILGWSPRIFPIVRELVIATASERRPTVVIFTETPREQVLIELGRRVGNLGKLKLVVRTGKPTIPADLARTNLSAASSIIILDDNDNADATTISIVLAIKAAVGDKHPAIVAEIDDPYIAETLRESSGQIITAVRSQDIIARMTAQASRRSGLAAVILDLIDFDGNEIYVTTVPQLVGQTYGTALGGFATSSVIGLVDSAHGVRLNPPVETVIAADAQVIVVAEDDSSAIYSPVQFDLGASTHTRPQSNAQPEHLLVIGWSSMGRAVLESMAGFLAKGSTVHIVAREKFVEPATLSGLDLGHIAVRYTPLSASTAELIAVAKQRRYDAVLVLGYRNAIESTEADAQTMLTMLQMNALFATDTNAVQPTRLVAEVLDSTMVELAQVAASGDLVVSDVLAALVIAQVSQNPTLAQVFTDLFDADGAHIEMEPIERYASIGESVSFGTLVARAATQGASAFGYRSSTHAGLDPSRGARLNPTKSHQFTIEPGDSLVVVRD
jgi:hypothetical protein